MKKKKVKNKHLELQKSLAKIIYKASNNTQELVQHTVMFAASTLGTLLCMDESFDDDKARATTQRFLGAISQKAFSVYYHNKEKQGATTNEQNERDSLPGDGEQRALDDLFGDDSESTRASEEQDSKESSGD